jgi:hypothetical protein
VIPLRVEKKKIFFSKNKNLNRHFPCQIQEQIIMTDENENNPDNAQSTIWDDPVLKLCRPSQPRALSPPVSSVLDLPDGESLVRRDKRNQPRQRFREGFSKIKPDKSIAETTKYLPDTATVEEVFTAFQNSDTEPPHPLSSYLPDDQKIHILTRACRGASVSVDKIPAIWANLICEMFIDFSLSGGRTKIRVICKRCGCTRATWDQLIKSQWGPSISKWYEDMIRDMLRFRIGPIAHGLADRCEKTGNARGIELLLKLTGMMRDNVPNVVPVQWNRTVSAPDGSTETQSVTVGNPQKEQ